MFKNKTLRNWVIVWIVLGLAAGILILVTHMTAPAPPPPDIMTDTGPRPLRPIAVIRTLTTIFFLISIAIGLWHIADKRIKQKEMCLFSIPQ